MKILIPLLIGISCLGLWFFGKSQPIVVIEQTVSANRQISCAACRGKGSYSCYKCGGSGSLVTFKSLQRGQCPQCKGKGKFVCSKCQGTGRLTVSEPQKVKIVRADLSLWEKILARGRVEPDKNCRPQRKVNGSYPLIAKYIETITGPAYNIRVVKWEPARLAGSEWIVKTVIEFKDKNGQPVQEVREFIIENRGVKGSRKAG